jgi:hypothetical protein
MIEQQKFTVVFEILGQKFRTVVPAEDEGDAKAKVRRAIKFISVENGVYSKQETVNKKPNIGDDFITGFFGQFFK